MTLLTIARHVFAKLAVAAVIGVGALPATAQTRAEMNEKIEALEKQLRAVQRQVFDQDSPYFQNERAPAQPNSAPAGGAANSGLSPARAGLLADLTVRVEELSSQLSALTGQVEELRHENRQLRERLSRFERDVALRLNRLEAGTSERMSSNNSGSLPTNVGSIQGRDGLQGDGSSDELAASSDEPAAASASEATAALPAGTPEQLYEHAYGLLRRGQMEEAEQAFRAFLDRHEGHALAANAQYWLGETYYVRQEYPQAAQTFLTGYQDYGDGGKAADSLLKLGMTLAAMGQTDDACAAFDELEARFSDLEERIDRRMDSERRRLGCS